MKTIYLFLALFLTLGLTSCSFEEDILEAEQQTMTTKPPSDEAGEEDVIEDNN